jgi:hypothetical protein
MKFEGVKLYRCSSPSLNGDAIGGSPVAVKIAKAIFRATGNGDFKAMSVSPQEDHWFCRPPNLANKTHEDFEWLGKMTVKTLVFEPGVLRVVPS